MLCKNCNKEIPDESKFCPGCGTKIEVNNTSFEDIDSELKEKLSIIYFLLLEIQDDLNNLHNKSLMNPFLNMKIDDWKKIFVDDANRRVVGRKNIEPKIIEIYNNLRSCLQYINDYIRAYNSSDPFMYEAKCNLIKWLNEKCELLKELENNGLVKKEFYEDFLDKKFG